MSKNKIIYSRAHTYVKKRYENQFEGRNINEDITGADFLEHLPFLVGFVCEFVEQNKKTVAFKDITAPEKKLVAVDIFQNICEKLEKELNAEELNLIKTIIDVIVLASKPLRPLFKINPITFENLTLFNFKTVFKLI